MVYRLDHLGNPQYAADFLVASVEHALTANSKRHAAHIGHRFSHRRATGAGLHLLCA